MKFFKFEEFQQKRETFLKLTEEFLEEQKKLSKITVSTKKQENARKEAIKRIENLQLDSYDVSYDYCIIATCD